MHEVLSWGTVRYGRERYGRVRYGRVRQRTVRQRRVGCGRVWESMQPGNVECHVLYVGGVN